MYYLWEYDKEMSNEEKEKTKMFSSEEEAIECLGKARIEIDRHLNQAVQTLHMACDLSSKWSHPYLPELRDYCRKRVEEILAAAIEGMEIAESIKAEKNEVE